MFQKVLVANRGEIAIRVMRAARELGLPTVAVYSDLDRDARHTLYADEAFHIGGAPAADSYLKADRILDVARAAGADAIHPGYGFLAENAEFAQRVADAGVTWVGPPPEAIRAMGDKLSSRHAAARANVASVPGTMAATKSVAEILEFGAQHGWPVAIKASAGGGGKGLKVAASPDEAERAMESARREAQAYFGNPEVYLERYLGRPRHVEIQVFGDTHGNYVHLGERDCSVQRRHQKLIEESPSPGLPDEVRRKMGEAAVAVARACGYVNAGTVECLVDEDWSFYFLEMNTRLQVEHCVTEMVTGIDLAKEQFRVAMGEPLSFTQADISPLGHAIECRVNAEDPAKNFMPSPGTIGEYREPGGWAVRVDSGYGAGSSISQFYDNLIAKVVVWGRDREEARTRMLRALHEFRITGVATTIPAHLAVLTHPVFIAGHHTTNFVGEHPELFEGLAPAAVTPPPADEPVTERAFTVQVSGKRFDVRVWTPEAEPAAPAGLPSAPKRKPRAVAAPLVGDQNTEILTSPMQGTIVKTMVATGDTVKVGDAIVILEAMKMENEVKAHRAGTVTDLKVQAGDTVGSGDVIAVIQ